MIKITNLNFGFNGNNVLNDINLTIDNGDYVAIIGPNGSGKSTLIKCLIGMNKVTHNSIQIDNQCISCFNQYQRIGYVAQVKNKETELPITPSEYLNLISKDQAKIAKLAEQLQLTPFFHNDINKLSGGQKQRVNIAKALLNDIQYLILDEPNTGLDEQSRIKLYQILKQLKKDNLTIIIVSHHLSDFEQDANKVYDLSLNRLIKE